MLRPVAGSLQDLDNLPETQSGPVPDTYLPPAQTDHVGATGPLLPLSDWSPAPNADRCLTVTLANVQLCHFLPI